MCILEGDNAFSSITYIGSENSTYIRFKGVIVLTLIYGGIISLQETLA